MKAVYTFAMRRERNVSAINGRTAAAAKRQQLTNAAIKLLKRKLAEEEGFEPSYGEHP